MSKKSMIFVVLAIIIGAGVGIAGYMGAQNFFPGQSDSKVSTSKKGPTMSLGEFTVNLQGGYMARVGVTIEVINAKALVQVKEREPFLKDKANLVLSDRPVKDYQGMEAKIKLKEELLAGLNQVADGNVADVLFDTILYN